MGSRIPVIGSIFATASGRATQQAWRVLIRPPASATRDSTSMQPGRSISSKFPLPEDRRPPASCPKSNYPFQPTLLIGVQKCRLLRRQQHRASATKSSTKAACFSLNRVRKLERGRCVTLLPSQQRCPPCGGIVAGDLLGQAPDLVGPSDPQDRAVNLRTSAVPGSFDGDASVGEGIGSRDRWGCCRRQGRRICEFSYAGGQELLDMIEYLPRIG